MLMHQALPISVRRQLTPPAVLDVRPLAILFPGRYQIRHAWFYRAGLLKDPHALLKAEIESKVPFPCLTPIVWSGRALQVVSPSWR
jgi:hypothetical protein